MVCWPVRCLLVMTVGAVSFIIWLSLPHGEVMVRVAIW
jgi:hypothetical protein